MNPILVIRIADIVTDNIAITITEFTIDIDAITIVQVACIILNNIVPCFTKINARVSS